MPKLTDQVQYPYLLLLASGGHCQFVAVEGLGKYKILGKTLDDAIGEAFDKVAKMMNLGFPGGPEIEKRAQDGDAQRFHFPKPMINSGNCDMSFSGLKTAVRLEIEKLGEIHQQDIADVAASFQQVVAEIICKKTKYAIDQYEELYQGKTIVVSGGVAANLVLRKSMQELSASCGYNFVAPPIKLCTDNAVMIAFAGLSRFKDGKIDHVDFRPRARWSLEELDY
jgi:N6-L-threonylcarbamoyladenine synthase